MLSVWSKSVAFGLCFHACSCVVKLCMFPDLEKSSSSSSPEASEQRPLYMSQNSMSSPSIHKLLTPQKRTHHRRSSSGDKLKVQLSPEFKKEIASRRGVRSFYVVFFFPSNQLIVAVLCHWKSVILDKWKCMLYKKVFVGCCGLLNFFLFKIYGIHNILAVMPQNDLYKMSEMKKHQNQRNKVFTVYSLMMHHHTSSCGGKS